MSHFGRSGPPDIKDTFSLLVLNITFRTSADDLYPLFIKYGKVVDIFIPRDRRTGDSRGFAFVRYKYADEASRAVERLDGRNVDGRNIMVQFAKYGPNAERIHKGRVIEDFSKTKDRSPSRSPRPRYCDEYRGRNYRSSWSPSGRYEHDRYDRDRGYRHRSRSRSLSPEYRGRRRDRGEDYRGRSRSRSRSLSPEYRGRRSRSHTLSPEYRGHGRGRHDDYRSRSRSRSLSYKSASPARRSITPERSLSPRRTATHAHKDRSPPRSASPLDRHGGSRSPSSHSVE